MSIAVCAFYTKYLASLKWLSFGIHHLEPNKEPGAIQQFYRWETETKSLQNISRAPDQKSITVPGTSMEGWTIFAKRF